MLKFHVGLLIVICTVELMDGELILIDVQVNSNRYPRKVDHISLMARIVFTMRTSTPFIQRHRKKKSNFHVARCRLREMIYGRSNHKKVDENKIHT